MWSLSTGKDVQHGSFIANYTGLMDWGELADKIYVGFMQLLNTDKYVNLFREELEKVGIPCTIEGPFPKRLPKHDIPIK